MPGLVGLFPNIIKLSGAQQTNCITNFPTKRIYIAINPNVSYGETATTDFWNGITPSVGGYIVYVYKPTGGPLIFGFSDDTGLINFVNKSYSTSYTTISEALTKIIISIGIFCVNYDYPYFPTDELLLNYDAWYSASYPKSYNSFYDTSGNGVTASMTNGNAFQDNGIRLTTNQVIDLGTNLTDLTNDFTFSIFFSFLNFPNTSNGLVSKGNAGSTGFGLWFDNAGDLYFSHAGIDTFVSGGFTVDTRYLFTMRYTPSTIEFFINGNPSGSKDSVSITDGSSLIIGVYNGNRYGNCRIYSIKKYNIQLENTDISNMFDNLNVLYSTILI